MARPASQATAGYFPTPEHLIPAIGSLLTIERDRYDRPLLFDPCAGTGSALLGLAAAVLDLDPADASRYCQAIELEATRAEVLKRRLPHGAAHHGDAFAFGISAAPGVSVLFLNPPYDTDPEHRRLEQRFLGTRLAVLNSQPGATVNEPGADAGVGLGSREGALRSLVLAPIGAPLRTAPISAPFHAGLCHRLPSTGKLSGSTTFSLYRDVRDGTNISSAYRCSALMWSMGGNLGLKLRPSLTAQTFANYFPTQSILRGRASGYTFTSIAVRQHGPLATL